MKGPASTARVTVVGSGVPGFGVQTDFGIQEHPRGFAVDVAPALRRNGNPRNAEDLDRQVRAQVASLSVAAETFEPAEIKAALKEIVPEYTPAGAVSPA